MTPVAPLVAGHWPRRIGGQAGPFGVSAGSGESAAGPLQVELWFDGQWNTITSSVMTRDGSLNVAITRGQSDEASQVEPARCTMQLNNRNGIYSPRNPLSPLFGKIGRNQPIRVSVPVGNDRNVRFLGEVVAWPQEWDITGTDVWVPLEAAGILRRLGQGSRAIGSAMYAALASAAPTNLVAAYWPCEDAVGSTRIGSAITGVPAMTISGTPTLATNSAFVCSGPLPTMGTASFSALIPTYTTPGNPLDTLNPFTTIVRLLLAVPQAGITTGTVIASWVWTGSIPVWEIYYSTASSGQLGLRGKDSSGTVVLDTGLGASGVNGALLHVSAELQNAGGILFSAKLRVTTVGSNAPTTLSASSFGPISGLLQSLTIGPAQTLGDTVVGHISLQLSPDTPTDTSDVTLLAAAYAGETAAARISRLCGLAGIGFELIGTASDSVAMGTQLSATLLSLISDAVTADGGMLFERTSASGLGYRTRVSMENQAAALALSYSSFQLSEVPVPVDDDQHTRNDVTASRPGGSSARATLTSGAMSTQAPPAGVGQYDETVQVNVQSDADLLSQATWRMHLGTVDEARYPRLSINMAHPSITSPTRSSALQLRPGDRLTVSDLPAWLPPDAISQLVLGTSETIDQFQHRITFNCQPESPYRVAITDSSTYGRADTAGSVLAADAGTTDTVLSLATTSGPSWITTAANPLDFPMDLRISGEVVRVNAIGTVADTFTRTVASDWGTADAGGAWTAVGGSASDYAVSGSVATHLNSAASVSHRTSLPGTYGDTDIYVTVSSDSLAVGAMHNMGIVARVADANNLYYARVSPQVGNAINLAIASRVAGAETALTTVTTGLTHAAGTQYRMRFQLVGTTLRAKVWLLSDLEPTAWLASTTDSNFASGQIGVRSFVSAGGTVPVTMSFDDFAVLDGAGNQTATVTRSVNGVVKSLPAGSDVRLNQPATVAL